MAPDEPASNLAQDPTGCILNSERMFIQMSSTINHEALGRHLREAREAAGVTQTQAHESIDASQPTYSRIEAGKRPLKGDELIILADRFGVRVAAITGLDRIRQRARFASRTDAPTASMDKMRDKLCAYLELDSYLDSQGVTVP